MMAIDLSEWTSKAPKDTLTADEWNALFKTIEAEINKFPDVVIKDILQDGESVVEEGVASIVGIKDLQVDLASSNEEILNLKASVESLKEDLSDAVSRIKILEEKINQS